MASGSSKNCDCCIAFVKNGKIKPTNYTDTPDYCEVTAVSSPKLKGSDMPESKQVQ